MAVHVIKLVGKDGNPDEYVCDLYETSPILELARVATTAKSVDALIRKWEGMIKDPYNMAEQGKKFSHVLAVPVTIKLL